MLDIAPGLEKEFTERARANGMTTDQYLAKLLSADKPQPASWLTHAPDHSAEAQRAAIHALLALPREEIARRNAPSSARLEARLAEAESAFTEQNR